VFIAGEKKALEVVSFLKEINGCVHFYLLPAQESPPLSGQPGETKIGNAVR